MGSFELIIYSKQAANFFWFNCLSVASRQKFFCPQKTFFTTFPLDLSLWEVMIHWEYLTMIHTSSVIKQKTGRTWAKRSEDCSMKCWLGRRFQINITTDARYALPFVLFDFCNDVYFQCLYGTTDHSCCVSCFSGNKKAIFLSQNDVLFLKYEFNFSL